MNSFFILLGLFAGALALPEELDVEARGLKDKRLELNGCLGKVDEETWMMKMKSKADVENCVKKVLGTSDPGPFIKCIGLRKGQRGAKKIWRMKRASLFNKCAVTTETYCPGKRAVDDEEEEAIDIETRGLFSSVKVDDLKDCLGSVRNKLLTAIKDKQGWAKCIKQQCPNYDDSVINGAAKCVGLVKGYGPGPKCDWHDYFESIDMMIMNNRGRLGNCIREQGVKCQ